MKEQLEHLEHLSDQQVMDWLLDEQPAGARAHLETCAACAGRVAQLAEPIGAFRKAATAWSEVKAATASTQNWSHRPSMRRVPMALVWASVLLVIAGMTTPLVLHRQSVLEQARQRLATSQRSASAARELAATSTPNTAATAKGSVPVESASLRAQDAVLLEQVDDDVSQSVPQAMAPLTVLVSWSSTETTDSQPATGTAVDKKQLQKD